MTLVCSSDRKRIVALARAAGKSDEEIMKAILRGEYGVKHRKQLLLDWADALGKGPNEILREAVRFGLLPDDRMP